MTSPVRFRARHGVAEGGDRGAAAPAGDPSFTSDPSPAGDPSLTGDPSPAGLPGAAPAVPAVTCGLCGHRFTPTRETMACARCPMAGGCAVLCCPRCGYEFVTESRLVNFVRRLFSR